MVGLGNPGSQYEKNRHNAGFLFLEYLLSRNAGSWSSESKFHGLIGSCVIGGNKVLLLKPQTFMNRSGLSVGLVARFYKYKPDEILVVHDELDIATGLVKYKKNGGHAGHNGLRDIIANLGARDFYRLRVGVGRPSVGSVADYVLSNPSKDDKERILQVFVLLEEYMESIVAGEDAAVMNGINKK
jgi:PTH1 family peptidyl-tRNA hydrolase